MKLACPAVDLRRLTITLPAWLVAKIEAYAARHGEDLDEVIAQAMAHALRAQKL